MNINLENQHKSKAVMLKNLSLLSDRVLCCSGCWARFGQAEVNLHEQS